ncbi:hypothetical protein EXE43_26920, partial [Halorubrum sp. SS5]
MADRSGGDESVSTTADRERTDDVDADALPDARSDADTLSDADSLPDDLDDAGVDEEVKRRLREAYLNDEENALIVTRVR